MQGYFLSQFILSVTMLNSDYDLARIGWISVDIELTILV